MLRYIEKRLYEHCLQALSTRPRATQQGPVKYRRHITVPAVPTQEGGGGWIIKKLRIQLNKLELGYTFNRTFYDWGMQYIK